MTAKIIAVTIAIGLDKRSWLQDYWSTAAFYHTPPWYGTLFPRQIFEEIFYTMLHVSSNQLVNKKLS